eukprot:CAMPEP_0172636056 /NCGR_PEP_ID=MMETSP1068-20121228/202206_1 /TAXON_ID=35684 /ORGANISM="Pseudopedinella elastica, Strain CCMP716" /LENGTH=50 /DNA_ID=CAMNT_0013448415 /DNA_START=41 /DNA_END=189 /DNA_ORIENTATION=-
MTPAPRPWQVRGNAEDDVSGRGNGTYGGGPSTHGGAPGEQVTDRDLDYGS